MKHFFKSVCFCALVRLDFTCLRVALAVHWHAFERYRSLWCFTGYDFVDDKRSHAAWHSSCAPVYTYFQLILRFAGCAVVAFYTYFQGKGCHAASMTGWLAGWLAGCLAAWLLGWLAAWLVGWLLGWLVGWPVGWLVAWKVCLLAGRNARGERRKPKNINTSILI